MKVCDSRTARSARAPARYSGQGTGDDLDRQGICDGFARDPQKILEAEGIILPENMAIEFQKPGTDRPRIVVYEKRPNSNFRLRVLYLQLVMMKRVDGMIDLTKAQTGFRALLLASAMVAGTPSFADSHSIDERRHIQRGSESGKGQGFPACDDAFTLQAENHQHDAQYNLALLLEAVKGAPQDLSVRLTGHGACNLAVSRMPKSWPTVWLTFCPKGPLPPFGICRHPPAGADRWRDALPSRNSLPIS